MNYYGEYELISNYLSFSPLVYDPEMYVPPLLLPEKASYYQTIICVIRWMVELGRVDIAVEVSQLSSLFAMPYKGHMVSDLRIMSYLIIRHNSRLILDPSYSDINLSEFKSDDNWTAFYGDSKEAKPHNAPKPLCNEIELIMFVNSEHAGDKKNHRPLYEYVHDKLAYQETGNCQGHFF